MKVNILGTEYNIEVMPKGTDPRLNECDGYCDKTIKKIAVEDFATDDRSVHDLELYKRQVIRHEIIHAFLYESGLDSSSWAADEEIVDYMAIQFPKLVAAFSAAKVMD